MPHSASINHRERPMGHELFSAALGLCEACFVDSLFPSTRRKARGYDRFEKHPHRLLSHRRETRLLHPQPVCRLTHRTINRVRYEYDCFQSDSGPLFDIRYEFMRKVYRTVFYGFPASN